MSAINSLQRYLSKNKGERLSAGQIRTMFKVDNPYDLVYRLRNEGTSIYTNKVKNSRGQKVFTYRLGTPSQRFTDHFKAKRMYRARRALYGGAISVA